MDFSFDLKWNSDFCISSEERQIKFNFIPNEFYSMIIDQVIESQVGIFYLYSISLEVLKIIFQIYLWHQNILSLTMISDPKYSP